MLREKVELSTQACNTESSLKAFVFVCVYLKGAAYVQVTDFSSNDWDEVCVPYFNHATDSGTSMVHMCKRVKVTRSEGLVSNKYTLSQSHHWCHRSETAEPITVKHDANSSNEESACFPVDAERHHKSAARGRACEQLISKMMIEMNNKKQFGGLVYVIASISFNSYKYIML